MDPDQTLPDTDTAAAEKSSHQPPPVATTSSLSTSPASQEIPGPVVQPSSSPDQQIPEPVFHLTSSPDKVPELAVHLTSSPDQRIPGLEVQPPSSPVHSLSSADLKTPELPVQLPSSAGRETPGSTAYLSPEPLPGPSFISVTLMDVMEAVRLTHVRLDQLFEEVNRVRQQVTTLQQQSSHEPGHPPALHSPAVSAEQRPPTAGEQQHLTPRSSPERQKDERQRATDPSLLIIGDSNVRRLEGIESKRSGRLAFHSISGATTDHVKQQIDQSVSNCDASEVVIHVGTNDIVRKGSEEVVKDVLDLAQKTKSKDGVRRVYVCSVTSRKDRGSFMFSRSESVNNRLQLLCPRSGIGFIDLRARLERCQFSGLVRDAVHYNKAGSKQAMKMITESVGYFLP